MAPRRYSADLQASGMCRLAYLDFCPRQSWLQPSAHRDCVLLRSIRQKGSGRVKKYSITQGLARLDGGAYLTVFLQGLPPGLGYLSYGEIEVPRFQALPIQKLAFTPRPFKTPAFKTSTYCE
jgi:hypothetical protein